MKADDTEILNHIITSKIRKVPGITSTVTLVVIEEQGGSILAFHFVAKSILNIIGIGSVQT